ncbi:MAG TPA: cbb3-type cytochrome c oxidase subunit II [Gammaproteobacteria bacterium]|nr:cbb3-type cytochrome c oxidase subunit II [Gammaproteobacteria bacterium]
MKKMWMVFGGATLVYAVLAVVMGVAPGYWLSQTPPGPGVEPLTALQAEGRQVYVDNGCSYCHTQQVRPLPMDKIFGRPSAAGDFAYQTPELLGSERTGPDLTNIGKRQPSAIWQYIHLYNPRAVSPHSIMPSFAWMFKVVDKAPEGVTPVPIPAAFAPSHGVVIPTHEAVALVAYLKSLKQAPLPGRGGASGHTLHAMRETAAAPVAGPAAKAPADKPQPTPATSSAVAFDPAKGKQIFAANCAACHQASGTGLPGVFPPLKGNKAVNDPDPGKHIHVVLHGLHGETLDGVTYAAAMPAFADILSDDEIAAVINYERSSWGNHGKLITPAEVTAVRKQSK